MCGWRVSDELSLDGYVADVPDDMPAVAAVLVAEERIEQKKREERDLSRRREYLRFRGSG